MDDTAANPVEQIELLIAHGRLDEAEHLLKDASVPNSGEFQGRINALRVARVSKMKQTRQRRLITLVICAVVLVAAVLLFQERFWIVFALLALILVRGWGEKAPVRRIGQAPVDDRHF